ncbi:hypothetical protein AA313_de0208026 [Arthrobotrys entomopaga]|nr:hypothetical protein AA313_de0208026 [Arthrobotrys entomopaga]
MGKDDYASVGGSLRLKGSAGISKHRSKKKSKSTKQILARKEANEEVDEGASADASVVEERATPEQEAEAPKPTKTEAERKFEEARKKKLDQQLIRDAAKSHKERVEEFNKYLSNLSEHHDM